MSKPTKCGDKWRIRWPDAAGVRRSAVFEVYAEAKVELARRIAEVEEIKAGRANAPPPPKTFGDLADYWLLHRAPLKRSGKDDESVIRKHLRPSFGHLQLVSIGTEQVDRFVSERRELHAKTVLNLLTLLSTMLNLAVDLNWLARAPKIRKPKVRIFDQDFRYLRTRDDVRKFLQAAGEDGEDTLALYATAVFTGMREGELAALRWADVQFDTRLITVQRSFDGPTKSGDVRYVPILDDLLPILRQWRLSHPGVLVFTNRDGNMLQPCSRIFAERLHRVLDAAGFERPTKGRNVHALNFHSLRHTFASQWMMAGGDLFKLQRILGHKDVKMTQRYAHLAPNAFAGDLGRMSGLVPAAPESVVRELRPGSRAKPMHENRKRCMGS